MTWASDRVGCSVFLNNRYYDPTLGAFTSVDPLVAKTGTPYLYANGNPPTLSDPTGLSSCGTQEGPDTTVCGNEYEDNSPTPTSTCPPKCGGAPKPKSPNLPGSSGPSAPTEPTQGAGGGPVNSQQYAQYNREFCEVTDCTPPPRGWADVIIIGAFVVLVGGTICVMSGVVICATAVAGAGTSAAPAALDWANGGPGTPSPDDGPMLLANARRGIDEILLPGGSLIGKRGTDATIREITGGLSDAQAMFQQLSVGGTIVQETATLTRVQLANGGFVQLRTVMARSPETAATIDVNVPGIDITKLKFNP